MKYLTKIMCVGLMAGMLGGCPKNEAPAPAPAELAKQELYVPSYVPKKSCVNEIMEHLVPLKEAEKIHEGEESYLTINNKDEFDKITQCMGPKFAPKMDLYLSHDLDSDGSLDLVYDPYIDHKLGFDRVHFVMYTSKLTDSQKKDYDKQINSHLVTPFIDERKKLETLVRSDEFLESLPYPLKLQMWSFSSSRESILWSLVDATY
jgi:hypothetical protein